MGSKFRSETRLQDREGHRCSCVEPLGRDGKTLSTLEQRSAVVEAEVGSSQVSPDTDKSLAMFVSQWERSPQERDGEEEGSLKG